MIEAHTKAQRIRLLGMLCILLPSLTTTLPTLGAGFTATPDTTQRQCQQILDANTRLLLNTLTEHAEAFDPDTTWLQPWQSSLQDSLRAIHHLIENADRRMDRWRRSLRLIVLSLLFGFVCGLTQRQFKKCRLVRENSTRFHRFAGYKRWVFATTLAIPLGYAPSKPIATALLLSHICLTLTLIQSLQHFKKYG